MDTNEEQLFSKDVMAKKKVSDLKPGMVVAAPITSETGYVLMYEGAELSEEHINKLVSNNIESIYVITEFEKETDSFTIEELKKDSVAYVETAIQKRVRENNDEDLQKLIIMASDIINSVLTDSRVVNSLIDIRRKSEDIYSHMMNVSAMSTIIGIKMGMDETSLKDIALGALIHDIGLGSVSVPFYDIEMDKMPAKEKLNYRMHVIEGYEYVQQLEWVSDTVKEIVLSHHERMDASGYPFHKAGERISEEVMIVAICDFFDEFANGIGYKKRKTHEVVEFLRSSGSQLFNYSILKQVFASIAWFPTGTKVFTNERELGIVVKQNKALPDRPVLRILKDANGVPVEKEEIKDLTELLTVFIMDTIEDDE